MNFEVEVKTRKLALVLLSLGMGFAIYFLSHIFWFSVKDTRSIVDLSGIWEVCAPESPHSPDCNWTQVQVPSDLPRALLKRPSGWLVYRKTFSLLKNQCSANEPCSFFAGEVGDATEVSVNGQVLGRQGDFPPQVRYAKQYPVHFYASPEFLKDGNNTLTVNVYYLKSVQSGIRKGPVGIYRSKDALSLARFQIALNVLLPLFGAIGLFLMGAVSLVGRGSIKGVADSFSLYCVAWALFLLSFSEVPREYLPIWLAGYLHLFLRFLGDWCYFELIVAFFGYRSRIWPAVRKVYFLFLVSYFVGFLYHLIWLRSNAGMDGIGFHVAFIITRIAVPLLILPHVMGFVGGRRLVKSERWVVCTSMLFTTAFQLWDSSIFHGFVRGTYIVKIYPLFIGVLFGWLILKRVVQRNAEAYASEIVARQALQVAHDIRSPLAALEVLKAKGHEVDAEKEMFAKATDRIRRISEDLLAKGKRGSRSMASRPLAEILEAIVREKRVLISQGSRQVVLHWKCETPSIQTEETGEWERALSSLLDNAVDAIDGKGEITVRLYSSGNLVCLEVSDTGRGMSVDILRRAGERGFSSGKENGNGLGLHYVKTFAMKNGGDIQIKSAKGAGTNVSLWVQK